jgi:hypothetical protein
LQKEQQLRPSAEAVLRMPLFKAPLLALQREMELVLRSYADAGGRGISSVGLEAGAEAEAGAGAGAGAEAEGEAGVDAEAHGYLTQAAMLVSECKGALRTLHGGACV